MSHCCDLSDLAMVMLLMLMLMMQLALLPRAAAAGITAEC